MSFFNKILGSIGIGSASVDTLLSHSAFKVGETINGIVEVKGGNIKQNIDEIYLTINTNYEKEEDGLITNKSVVISTLKINEPFVIMPEEVKTVPFTVQVPLDTPISTGSSKVWIQTSADIKGSKDPTDKDMIKILPNDLVEKSIEVFTQLGFKLHRVKNEAASYKVRKRLPFIQEYQFIPTGGLFYQKIDEVEVVFFPIEENKIEMIFEVDRRGKGLFGLFSEALDIDETVIRLTLDDTDLPTIRKEIEAVIEKHI